ncbi:hypothetical protein AC249_AIPGENE297 [Exaiptasia diaphana]|nr:hypothetical protein AC249_AIPGENE297 [Exaiptasia diaphana]
MIMANQANNTTTTPLNSSQIASHEQATVLILKVVEAALYGIIAVISIVGNSFLILAYRRNITGQMRSVYNLLVASIGASDLLLAIWSIPERMTRVIMDDAWLIDGVMGCDTTSRPFGIGKSAPLKRFADSTEYRRQVSIFDASNVSVDEEVVQASEDILVTLYGGKKGVILCKVVNFVEKLSITVSFLHLGALAFDRSKRRMAKMVSVIVFAFYVCFLPYGVGWVGCSYLEYRPKSICNPWYKFVNILVLHFNCAINPIICLVFNLQYRLEWKLAIGDPFGLRVKLSRMSYRRRKSSTTTEAMMTINCSSNADPNRV